MTSPTTSATFSSSLTTNTPSSSSLPNGATTIDDSGKKTNAPHESLTDVEIGSSSDAHHANDVVKSVAASPAAEATDTSEPILKIPHLTPIYWCEKMTATTFGETFADFFTQTLKLGYEKTSIVVICIFAVCLGCQIKVKVYWPLLFWATMSTSSLAGTMVSDFIDRTLHWGYPKGMGVLLGILLFIIICWKLSGEYMTVEGAMNRRAEAFYWATILVSNTLGTALGDFMSDSLGLGFGVSAGILGGILLVCAWCAYFTRISRVVLFWFVFVLTRPFGATFGDLLTKKKSKGGLDLGTLNASMVILGLFLVFFSIEMYQLNKNKRKAALTTEIEASTQTKKTDNMASDESDELEL